MDGELTPDLEPPLPRWTRQRTIALAAAVLFVGAVAGVALVVSGGGSSGPLPKLPLGATANSGSTVAAPALAPYGIVNYQVKGTLPALTGTAPAYRLPTAVDGRAPTRLAAALGLHGTFAPSGDGTQLTSGAKSLTISNGYGSPWWYGQGFTVAGGTVSSGSSGAASSGVIAPATSIPETTIPSSPPVVSRPPATVCPMPPCPPNALCNQACTPTTVPFTTVPPTVVPPVTVPRPADLPSSAQAEQIARTAAAAAGFDAANAEVTVTSGPDTVSVEFAPRIGGLPVSGYSWVFDLGSKGVIQDARGYLAQPARVGNYPLAGTAVGLARLERGMGVGPQPMTAEASPAMYPVCAPSASCPVRTVTITGVHLALANSIGYLVPAYVFTDGSGRVGLVPAASDAYLETPSPVSPATTNAVPPHGGPAPAPAPPTPAPKAPGFAPTTTIVPTTIVSGGLSPACGPQPPPGSAAPNSCKG